MGTYLNRTLSSPNVLKHTTSLWMKGSPIGTNNYIFSLTSGGHYIYLRRNTSNQLESRLINGAVEVGALVSNNLLRDPASWYHVVLRVDIANSTANNRLRLYLNGSEISYATQTQPASYPGASYTQFRTLSANTGNTNDPFLGYMADLNYFDGYSYGPDSFGETDSTTGEWKPKVDFTGVTYGTNGFRCEFGNAAALGTDTSGNSNTLTVNNAGTNAKTVDTASNNFATMNPIDVGTNLSQTTFSEGNLKLVSSGTTTDNGDQVVSSMGFTKGKWYWEIKGVSNPDNMFWTVFTDVLGGKRPYHDNYAYSFYGDGTGSHSQIYESQEGAQKGYGTDSNPCFSNNDIIQVAFDCDNYRLYIGKNGLWTDDNAASGGTITPGSAFNQSSPTGYYQISTVAAQAGFYRIAVVKAGSSVTYTAQVNFGNPPFTISSGNADANGYGNFEYAVPSGYYSLCTNNINSYG